MRPPFDEYEIERARLFRFDMTPEEILKASRKKIPKRSKAESLAILEEALFEAKKQGNKRRIDALKLSIKRIKAIKN